MIAADSVNIVGVELAVIVVPFWFLLMARRSNVLVISNLLIECGTTILYFLKHGKTDLKI